MRALFTCQPGLGHFLPLTPFARALAEAGHDVAFGTPRFFRDTVEGTGFCWERAGVERDDPELTALRARHLELRDPTEQQEFIYEQIFGGLTARRAVPDLLALGEAWRPDLLVHDSSEFGAMIAAELLDVPHAQVEVHASGARPDTMRIVYGPLQRLRASFGLPARSIQGLVDQYLGLTPFPASLNTAGVPIPPTTHHVRALPDDDPEGVLPPWIDELGSRPLIYVSLGSLWGGWRGPEIFSKLLAGLHELDAELVLTVGHDMDLAALGPQPSHVHLERYLPLGVLLPRCSLVVFHGGSGTLGHVVAQGLPMVILPLGADQPENATRCAELGASRTLDQRQLTPEHVRQVVLDVLHTPSYRRCAERLREEFERLPGAEVAVKLLEKLARDRSGIDVGTR